ncbi:SDR family oxidoreductase [Catalinimonas niigatensis]|uniref:SDR family oxidoreductase n=1 Tax=Catalinimonas niigatensis TaxID=1397264 RepID=UPI0026671C62|nr:SDR family oxidoreductase [Catalinimonas niigatensis]WPP48379.1 SDR family oxidoreductase [Catalinimonas niigatensis]
MKILLTGANGYIGMRLLPVLVRNGHDVVCLVRDKRRMKVDKSLQENISYHEADLLKEDSLKDLPQDLDAAYYLVHSIGASADYEKLEAKAAHNFVDNIKKTNCRQIIYLSGIVNDKHLSKHLRSRKNVEDILMKSEIPTTVLRAGIIIGSGGASFEIIRDLVEKLPVMIAPKWVSTKSQPIALRNVLQYLNGVLLKNKAYNKVFDIGGPEILSYKAMMLQFAEVRKLKRYIISVPVLSPRLSSLWLYFVTSTSFKLAQGLVDSMKNQVTVQRKGIEDIVQVDLLSYKEAVERAFDRIAQNEVMSSWKDSLNSSKININLFDHVKVPEHGVYHDIRKISFDKSKGQVINNIWSIGGDRGWYYLGFLWKIRGILDKIVGGVGLRRGRRSPIDLAPGDALDFWRVLVADKDEGRLLLYAEMKLPGEAWLEFKVMDEEGQSYLLQTATYRPQGLPGRLYWWLVYPFHGFIFPGMAKRIIHFEEKQREVAQKEQEKKEKEISA